MITEPEPEIEKAEVMMQTEAEEPTPVTDVDTQTIRVKLCENHMQTMKASLSHIHVQTDKPEMSHSLVQTDEVSEAIDGFGLRHSYVFTSKCHPITTSEQTLFVLSHTAVHLMIHLGGYNDKYCSVCTNSQAISCV